MENSRSFSLRGGSEVKKALGNSIRRKGDAGKVGERRFQLPSKPPTIATFSCSKLNSSSPLYVVSLPVQNTQGVHGASSITTGGFSTPASTVLGNGGVSYLHSHEQGKNFKGKRKNFGGEELIV